MAIQLGTGLRNNMIGQYETTVGTSAYIKLFTGAQPSTCQDGTSGTFLCNVALPSDWYGTAAGGTASKSGTWQGTAAAAGTAAHYRLYDNGTSVCSEQGSVGQGTGDLSLDNVSIASGQVVTVTQWDRSIGGA
jgi:hypothetical protein